MTIDVDKDILNHDKAFTVAEMEKLKHIKFFASLYQLSIEAAKESLSSDLSESEVDADPNYETDEEEETFRTKLRNLTLMNEMVLKKKLGISVDSGGAVFGENGLVHLHEQEQQDDEDEQDEQGEQADHEEQAEQEEKDEQGEQEE